MEMWPFVTSMHKVYILSTSTSKLSIMSLLIRTWAYAHVFYIFYNSISMWSILNFYRSVFWYHTWKIRGDKISTFMVHYFLNWHLAAIWTHNILTAVNSHWHITESLFTRPQILIYIDFAIVIWTLWNSINVIAFSNKTSLLVNLKILIPWFWSIMKQCCHGSYHWEKSWWVVLCKEAMELLIRF